MNEKWIEEIRHNDEMTMLDRYFPGKSCGNTECEQHCIEFCKIAERMGCMKKNEISSAVARLLVFPENCPALKSGLNHDSCRFQLFSQDRISVYDDQTGRRIIGKKYVSDEDNAKIVTSIDNIGTYNHFSPKDAVKHALFDVIPYWLWGNSENDHTPLGNRLLGN